MSAGPQSSSLPAPRPRDKGGLAWPAAGGASSGLEAWEPAAGVHEPSGRTFARIVRGRKGTIAVVFLATVVAVGYWVLTSRPLYTANVTLRIEKEEPRVLKFEDVVKSADPMPDYYQTQQRLLQSRTLVNRVIELLALDRHPDFQEPSGWASIDQVRAWARERLAPWVAVPPPSTPEAAGDLALESPLTRAFLGRLSIEPVRSSRLVKVSFDSHYPALAARIANTLAEAFVTQTLEFRADASRYATGFLGRQLSDARARLEKAEQQLSAFVRAKGINFVNSDRLPEREDLVTHELAILSDALVKARNERIAKESLAEEARQGDVDALPAVLQSPVIVKLKGDLATVEAQHRELGQTFRPEYPRMRRLEQSISELRSQIRSEVQRVTKALEADYRAALQNERQIEKSMESQRDRAMQLGDQMVQYNILRRDVDSSRELYAGLLTRLKETQISGDLITSPISIVDRAEVPLHPSRPRKTLTLLFGAIVGLLAGVAVAFVRERMDPRLRNIDDVERFLGVPRLGLVPERRRRDGRRLLLPVRRPPFAMVAHEATYSMAAEAFRDLRTNLLYAGGESPARTVMVTSPDAGDGKTALATNLAISLAQLGLGDVLLIDANLRHPQLHELLDVSRGPGLSAFLSGTAELPDVIRATDVANLWVIPSGRTPDNPAEVLASRRLPQALEALGEQFSHIIFDTSPLCGISDALNLVPRVDGVVLVLRHGRSDRSLAQDIVRRLTLMRANVLGVVINGADARVSSRRYRRWNYYGTPRGRDDDADDQ